MGLPSKYYRIKEQKLLNIFRELKLKGALITQDNDGFDLDFENKGEPLFIQGKVIGDYAFICVFTIGVKPEDIKKLKKVYQVIEEAGGEMISGHELPDSGETIKSFSITE